MAETCGTITCQLCSGAIPVRFTRLPGVGVTQGRAALMMDVAPLLEHANACTGRKALSGRPAVTLTVSEADLAGRIELLLNHPSRAFVAKGASRACTMCGIHGAECLERVKRSRKGCCPACENGNTHPAPGETFPCRAWAAEHGAKQ